MKAELIEYFKEDIRGRFIIEIRIWRVKDKRYPHNIKYSLVFVELGTGREVLMDNHYPKVPHVHLDDCQIPYEFSGVAKLLEDFKTYVFQHFGEKI